MRGINHLIVHVPKRYEDEYRLESGLVLERSHLFDDADNAIKKGTVVSTIEGSGIPEGATLYFHHAIVDLRVGGNVSETYLVDKEKSLYRIPYQPFDTNGKAYAWTFKGKTESIGKWIMLKQIYKQMETTDSGLIIVDTIEDQTVMSGEPVPKRLPTGQGFASVSFLNDYWKSRGIKQDDVILMGKDAEYPIEINGETYWRVWESFMLAKVN